MMVFHTYAPNPVLANYVRAHRLIHFNFSDASSIPTKPYPPRPEHTLSFYPRDSETVYYQDRNGSVSNLRSAIVGQHNQVSFRQVGRHFLVIQVVLQPGALFRLTGISANELTNKFIDAEAVFSKDLHALNSRLSGTEQHEKMIHMIEDFLIQKIKAQRKEFHIIDEVNKAILIQSAPTSVDSLASAACLSVKQFERKFMERVGFSPKYFLRIVRFEKAYRTKNIFPFKDWLTIALECGYHDYQHLVKDYIEFTGQTPVAFHLMDMQAPERAFGVSDTF
jgi:AraC-like DNA-binding protein